jgi:multimeric flavodoxin WrbA
MKVLGIYGRPRKGGNSDQLLNEALKGARDAGAEVTTIRCVDLDMSGCLECGGCDETGECVLQDDMQSVYPQLDEANAIIVASPMFFYGVSSQVKALIDRCQAMWNRRMLRKTKDQRRTHDRGRGYLLAVGATRGKNLFEGAQLVAKYFFDALDMTYEGGVFVRSAEGAGDIARQPEAMQEALELGRRVVAEFTEKINRTEVTGEV